MKLHTFRIGGIHPAENKIAAGSPIETLPLPTEAVLLLSQHIGAPAKPIVAKGDKVKRGDCVAEAGGFVSAPVHTPISGTVVKIDIARSPQGMPVEAIYIKSDEADRQADLEAIASAKPRRSDSDVAALDPKAIVDIIKNAGIVGLGGATFPAHVKLCPPPGSKAEVVIINAAECEPCLSCDDMLMREHAAEIVKGVQLLVKAAGVTRGVIGIENNKPQAIDSLSKACATTPEVEVAVLQVKYPQGGEKQLIEAVIGKEVPSGALPISTGAIVQNVATAYAVYRAVYHCEPILDRVLTLHDGTTGRNLRVALGTKLSSLIPEGTRYEKIILGGPMMGRTASTLDTPMVKGTSGILLDPKYAHRREPEPCIRCGKCVDACPMGLEPYLLSTLSRLHEFDEAEQQKIANCIECGSCSYACPASRPLVDYIRVGKGKVMAAIRARAAAAKA